MSPPTSDDNSLTPFLPPAVTDAGESSAWADVIDNMTPEQRRVYFAERQNVPSILPPPTTASPATTPTLDELFTVSASCDDPFAPSTIRPVIMSRIRLSLLEQLPDPTTRAEVGLLARRIEASLGVTKDTGCWVPPTTVKRMLDKPNDRNVPTKMVRGVIYPTRRLVWYLIEGDLYRGVRLISKSRPSAAAHLPTTTKTCAWFTVCCNPEHIEWSEPILYPQRYPIEDPFAGASPATTQRFRRTKPTTTTSQRYQQIMQILRQLRCLDAYTYIVEGIYKLKLPQVVQNDIIIDALLRIHPADLERLREEAFHPQEGQDCVRIDEAYVMTTINTLFSIEQPEGTTRQHLTLISPPVDEIDFDLDDY